jgi:hypothetical protein
MMSRIAFILLIASGVSAQGRYSGNGCFQEGKTAYGNLNDGTRNTDLRILNTLTAEHRLY